MAAHRCLSCDDRLDVHNDMDGGELFWCPRCEARYYPEDFTTPDELAVGRREDEPCERGTVGCCVHHDVGIGGGLVCETW